MRCLFNTEHTQTIDFKHTHSLYLSISLSAYVAFFPFCFSFSLTVFLQRTTTMMTMTTTSSVTDALLLPLSQYSFPFSIRVAHDFEDFCYNKCYCCFCFSSLFLPHCWFRWRFFSSLSLYIAIHIYPMSLFIADCVVVVGGRSSAVTGTVHHTYTMYTHMLQPNRATEKSRFK